MKIITHYTPTELLELYPDAQRIGWTPTKVGIFYRSGLLIGFLRGKEGRAMILEDSFLELINFANDVNLSKRIDIDK